MQKRNNKLIWIKPDLHQTFMQSISHLPLRAAWARTISPTYKIVLSTEKVRNNKLPLARRRQLSLLLASRVDIFNKNVSAVKVSASDA